MTGLEENLQKTKCSNSKCCCSTPGGALFSQKRFCHCCKIGEDYVLTQSRKLGPE